MRTSARPILISLVCLCVGAPSAAAAATLQSAQSPPTATITSGPPRYGHRSSVVFRFTVPAGTTSTECAVDDSAYRACANTYATGYLLDGRHVFSIRTVDDGGQAALLQTVFTIDTLKPQVRMPPTRVRIESTGAVTFTVTCPESEPGGCAGSIRLGTVPRKHSHAYREVASAPWQAGPSISAVVSMPVPVWAQKLAKAHNSLPVNVVLTADDDAGNVTLLRRRGALMPPLPSTGGGQI